MTATTSEPPVRRSLYWKQWVARVPWYHGVGEVFKERLMLAERALWSWCSLEPRAWAVASGSVC